MPSLTLSRARAVLDGVAPRELQQPVLMSEAALALKPVLLAHGFDMTQPIYVRELADGQEFHLMQE